MNPTYNVNYNNAFKNSNGAVLNKRPLFTNSFSQTFNGSGHNVKYYSGIDAEIYFEDIYIDEVVQIQFSVQQNALPIVGYNSYVYDGVALGSRLVQGQFAINFTSAEYLIDVLNTLSTKTTINKTQIISPEESSYDAKAAQLQSEANLVDTTEDSITQWRRQPLWKKNFNIVVSYGNYLNDSSSGTLLILDGVQLTGCTQGLAASGEPVTEIYSFIARDIQPAANTISSIDKQTAKNSTGDASDSYNMSIKSCSYSESSSVAYLNTIFNFNNNTPKTITANLSIPVTNADASQLNVTIYNKDSGVGTLNNDGIQTVLSDTIKSYVHAYETIGSTTTGKRPFSVYYTIYFTDSSGNIKQTTVSGSAAINNIN